MTDDEVAVGSLLDTCNGNSGFLLLVTFFAIGFCLLFDKRIVTGTAEKWDQSAGIERPGKKVLRTNKEVKL